MNGLAGPLHGLANQEVLRWTLDLQKKLGNKEVTNDELAKVKGKFWESSYYRLYGIPLRKDKLFLDLDMLC
jgi:citrate synthase